MKKDAGMVLRLLRRLMESLVLKGKRPELILKHLLHFPGFSLNLASDLFTLAAAFQIMVIGHFTEAFFYAAFDLTHLTFCLID
jgi:hypothetical protein